MKWLRKKDIVLNFYTTDSSVFNYSPVVEAKKEIPNWFKELPPPYFKSPSDKDINMKSCIGILDYYTTGFIVPLWSELYLKIGKVGSTEYEWQYSDCRSNLDTHYPHQYRGVCPETKYQHLKLTCPWVATCDEDIPFLITQPDWRFDIVDNIHISSGILNLKHQRGLNINLFFKREKEDTEIILKHRTPLLHLIPLTERKIVLKTHLVDHEKFRAIAEKNTPVSFLNHYTARKNILKAKGCPYQVDRE